MAFGTGLDRGSSIMIFSTYNGTEQKPKGLRTFFTRIRKRFAHLCIKIEEFDKQHTSIERPRRSIGFLAGPTWHTETNLDTTQIVDEQDKGSNTA